MIDGLKFYRGGAKVGRTGKVISLIQYKEEKRKQQAGPHYEPTTVEDFEGEAKDSLECFRAVTPPHVVDEAYERLLMRYLSAVAFVEANPFLSDTEVGRYLREILSCQAKRIYKSEPVFIITALDQLKIAESKRLAEDLYSFFEGTLTLPDTNERD